MGGQRSGKPVDNALTAGPGLLREPQPPGTRQAGSGGCGADIRPGPQALALLLRLCGNMAKTYSCTDPPLSCTGPPLAVSVVVEAGPQRSAGHARLQRKPARGDLWLRQGVHSPLGRQRVADGRWHCNPLGPARVLIGALVS